MGLLRIALLRVGLLRIALLRVGLWWVALWRVRLLRRLVGLTRLLAVAARRRITLLTVAGLTTTGSGR